jgi:hypothetical protein
MGALLGTNLHWRKHQVTKMEKNLSCCVSELGYAFTEEHAKEINLKLEKSALKKVIHGWWYHLQCIRFMQSVWVAIQGLRLFSPVGRFSSSIETSSIHTWQCCLTSEGYYLEFVIFS